MAKKPKTDKISGSADQSNEPLGVAGEAEAPAAPKAPKSRGPRGVTEDAVITLISTSNPKRPASKAFAAFSNYRDQMTVKEFADLVGAEATGHLVYDAKHGFISIAGYDPGAIIVPKPKAEKKVKEPKAADPDAGAVEEQAEATAEVME